MRADLDAELAPQLTPLRQSTSDDGQTVKFLSEVAGGHQVETVLMLYRDRATVCVSSQAGCAMGCGFCATGQAGFNRHLTTGEIVEQGLLAARRARDAGRRLSNVVHGMGEPPPSRRPCGLPSSACTAIRPVGSSPHRVHRGDHPIRKLTARPLPVTLAVTCTPLNDVVRLAADHQKAHDATDRRQDWLPRFPGRRISFEWALIDGVNDRPMMLPARHRQVTAAHRPREPDPAQPDTGYPTVGTPPARVAQLRQRTTRRERHQKPTVVPRRCRGQPPLVTLWMEMGAAGVSVMIQQPAAFAAGAAGVGYGR